MLFFPIVAVAAWPTEMLAKRSFTAAPWQAPGPNDDRAPCPGLNTLANHGYLNRNGRNITDDSIRTAFNQVYGLEDGVSNTLIGTIKDLKNQYGNLDLNTLRKHNVIEHDASLVHDDDFTSGGLNYLTNQALVKDFINFSSDKQSLTTKEVGQFRRKRQDTCKATNPQFDFGLKQQAAAFLEASTLITVFGKDGKVPIAALDSFLGQEKLPSNFQPRTSLIGLGESLKVAAQVKWFAGFF